MRRLAVYGKGGIGKSTISANLSVALARAGRSVLQIGCDPKHDSTKLLLGGAQPTCVLDYLRDTLPGNYDLNAVLYTGFAGVGCVEAGGPQPGVGCAGRGIISTFEMLEQFRLGEHYDTILYDVLGDVVCGGFAVPIRREYADTILIVTSGEFMALYAANNILRGVRTYDGETGARVAGIVCNRRNVVGEDERVARFASAVELPVFATVPRSDSFAAAEDKGMTVMEHGTDSKLVALFDGMAKRLVDGTRLYPARPLSDEELEAIMGLGSLPEQPGQEGGLCNAGQNDAVAEPERPGGKASSLPSSARIDLTDPNRYLSKTVAQGDPLHGCAFNGAVAASLHLTDAEVVAHAPTSCANLSLQAFSSSGRRALFERGTLLPASLAPNFTCTHMDEHDIVFGGSDTLLGNVREAQKRKPAAVIVVSSCPSGIIGDDIDRAAELSTPECPVLPLKADGNMTGDYLQGQLMASLAIARTFIQRDLPTKPKTVNIFAEKMVVTNTQANFEVVKGFLERMGVSVTCRFLYQASTTQLAQFTSAQLCLPAYSDYTAGLFGKLFSEEFGMRIFDRGFPIGFDETVEWLRAIGSEFGEEQIAEDIIREQEDSYRRKIDALRPALAGKKLMVVSYNCELDWILRTALDLGMDIVRVGLLDYSQDQGFRTRIEADLPVVENYAREARGDEVASLAPDVLLTNYASSVGDSVPVADTIPMCPHVGFESAVVLAQRWAQLLKTNAKGSWKDDGILFDQAFL